MSRAISLTSDPISQLTWRIALPASIGMFFNTMFNFIDTYCAGLLSTDALAALSLSFPVFFLLLAVGSGLSQGSTALIANALGAKNPDAARLVFAQSIGFTFFVGIAVSAIGLLISPTLFRQLGAEGEYLNVALAYIDTLLGGGVFFLLTMTLSSALNAQGETRIYRNFLIAGCLANLFLNPFLMWGWLGLPPMGVAGIALATVIVQFFGVLWLAYKVFSSELFRHLPVTLFRPHLPTIRLILSQSIPAALNMMTVALGIFVISWFVKHFGKEAIAASGIATRIEQVVLMPAIGLNTAVLSIVGQNHGAGLPHRVREAWLTNLKYGVGLMLAGGVLVWTLRDPAMRLFTNNPTVIDHGVYYLGFASITLAAYPILFVTVFMMQGLKRPAYGLWIGLYRQILAPVCVFYTLAFVCGMGISGVWWGIFGVTWSAALFALWWGWRTVRPKPVSDAYPIS
ncbi:MAG: MATE family efflux transporter [Verrucomicrobiota bacterium]